MNKKKSVLVVVSYYDRRPLHNLLQLLASMEKHDALERFSVCVVVNRTSERTIALPSTPFPCRVLYRKNFGMNIGAWDYGWRTNPGHFAYLFLQDECYVVQEEWLRAFRDKLLESRFGLLAESMNSAWDRPWPELRHEQENIILPEHEIEGKTINRVDFYLNFLRKYSIPPGNTGQHARSLVWFLKGHTLRKIDGFPNGTSYGECIAAEIAVSKKVRSVGLQVGQVDGQPFRYIRHMEWNQDYPGAPYTNKPLVLGSLRGLQMQVERPSWAFVARIVRNRLRQYVPSK